jgi:predicted nucleic acid-binding protein
VKLVDTSSWIEFLRGTKSEADFRVQSLLIQKEAAWCEIVVLELLNGARAGEVPRIQRLRNEVWFFEVDANVWALALNLSIAARASGMTTPTVDVVVAACARYYDLTVEHYKDDHFDMLASVTL